MCSVPCCDQYCAHCSPCSAQHLAVLVLLCSLPCRAHLAELNTCCAQYFSELSTLLCSPCCAQYLAVLSTLLNSVPCCAHLDVNSNLLCSLPCCAQYIAVLTAHLAVLNTLLSSSCRSQGHAVLTLLSSVPCCTQYLSELSTFLCSTFWAK